MMREISLRFWRRTLTLKLSRTLLEKCPKEPWGRKFLESLTPGQQVIKIVHEELINLMGSANSKVTFSFKTTYDIYDGRTSRFR